MNISEIKEMIQAVVESGVAELEVQRGENRVRIVRGGPHPESHRAALRQRPEDQARCGQREKERLTKVLRAFEAYLRGQDCQQQPSIRFVTGCE